MVSSKRKVIRSGALPHRSLAAQEQQSLWIIPAEARRDFFPTTVTARSGIDRVVSQQRIIPQRAPESYGASKMHHRTAFVARIPSLPWKSAPTTRPLSAATTGRPSMRLTSRIALPAIALAALFAVQPTRAAPHADSVAEITDFAQASSSNAAFAPPLRVATAADTKSDDHQSLGERIARRLQRTGLSDELIVVAVSALPVVELRAGVPIGIVLLGLPPLTVLLLAVAGNMIPVAVLLPLLQLRIVQRLAAPVIARAREKAAGVANAKSTLTALALFVGVPFPGTGGWTGTLVSFVLGLSVAQSFFSIGAGVLMSATIMTILSSAGRLGAAVAIATMLAVGISSMVAQRSGSAPPPDSIS